MTNLTADDRLFGIGLARMACNLADSRCKGDTAGICVAVTKGPVDRQCITERDANGSLSYPASAEYYNIIDRIARGEKP